MKLKQVRIAKADGKRKMVYVAPVVRILEID